MGKALTALAVEKMQPGPSRREVPDGLVSGLYLVVQPSGARSWAVRYRAGGAPKKYTFGTYPGIDLKNARELAQRALVDVAKGEDPAAVKKAARVADKAPSDRDLMEKVVDTFVTRYAIPNCRPSSAKEYRRVLDKEIVGRWKGKPLASIKRSDVHDMLDEIVDRGSPVQANRTLAAFRKLCSWAVDRGLIEASPCDRVKPPTAEQSRERVLADSELRLIWDACDGLGWPFGPLVKLLMLSGQRRDEIRQLRWDEIDFDAKLWTLPAARAKNGLEHTVPLSAPMLAILIALPRVGPYVFSTNGKTPVSGYSRAKTRVDALVSKAQGNEIISVQSASKIMPAWIFHDLRRTATTGMARLGTPLPVVERLLNHISGSFKGVAGVYNRHQFQDEKRHAMEAWGGFVERLVADTSNVLTLARIGS